MTSTTISIQIKCSPKTAYNFIVNPRNLPKWAKSFCRSVRKSGSKWFIETDEGSTAIQFVARNRLGVLDHYVSPLPGVEIYVPMRIIACGRISEVLFTLFRIPGMSAARYARDLATVKKDLASLKKVLEQQSAR